MNAKRKKILPKDNTELLELLCEDGEHLIIKKSSIDGLWGDNEQTTIYFNGNAIRVTNPLSELLLHTGLASKNTA